MNDHNQQRDETTGTHDDLLWRHLKSLPAFRALLRAVEARFYRHVQIPEPVLDLGCGDGHFGGMAFDRPLAIGADPWWGPLRKARRSGAYRLNVQALGDALPFADSTFASVFSNSVLEHIPDVQPVLAEANRILQPGGRLILTMPSHLFTEYLGGARLFGDSYRRFFNFISRHAHTDPPELWAQRLAQAGFRVTRWQYYFSPEALHALEIGHVQGFPSAVLHALTGHWILGPWRDNLRLTERWLRPYYEEPFGEEGAYIFVVAEKVAGGPVEVPLPPQQQFTLDELREEAPPAPEPAPAPLPAVAASAQSPIPELQSPAHEQPITAVENEMPIATGERSQSPIFLILLLAGLLFAFFGQSVLSQHPETPWSGLRLYVVAFVLLGGLALYRKAGPEAFRLDRLPRPRLLYPLAPLLALLAQRQTGTNLFEGRPVLALLLWLAAIALAFYALLAGSNDQTARPASPPRLPTNLQSPTSNLQSLIPNPRALIPLGLFLLALLPRILALSDHPFILNGIEASLGLDAVAVAQGQIRNPFATAWLTNPTLPAFLLAAPLQLLGRTMVGVRVLPALVGALTVPLTYLLGRRLWNERVGLVAALVLAGSHFHVHYSRLGMNNVWDPFWILLALGLLALARRRGTRRLWLLAGLAVGFSAYFYTASHLLPPMLVGLLLFFLLFDHGALRQQGRHMVAGMALALVVILPIFVYYNANPGIFMERVNTLGIFQSGWLLQVAGGSEQSMLEILGEQGWRAALAFNYTLDTSDSYNPGIPLLRLGAGLFFVLGVGLAVARLRELRHNLLLIWLGVTVLFAGALLVNPPDSHRLLVAAPAVALLVALGLTWTVEKLFEGVGAIEKRYLVPVVTVVALLLVAGDLFFYFGSYRQAHRFGDRNSEIAHEMGTYLRSLEGEWDAYFHGPPAMYVEFPTIPFLATGFRPGENLLNVGELETEAPSELPDGRNLVFIYLPERSGEVEMTQAAYPQGELTAIEGVLADPLFYVYEVRR